MLVVEEVPSLEKDSAAARLMKNQFQPSVAFLPQCVLGFCTPNERIAKFDIVREGRLSISFSTIPTARLVPVVTRNKGKQQETHTKLDRVYEMPVLRGCRFAQDLGEPAFSHRWVGGFTTSSV